MKIECKTPKSVRDLNIKNEGQNICRTSTTKLCNNCKKEKLTSDFYMNGIRPAYICKECALTHARKIYSDKKETIKARCKAYRDKNRKSITKKHTEYVKNRKKVDPAFKLGTAIRNHIYQFLKLGKKNRSIKYLGCTLEELRAHLESKFEPGMTWENHGRNGWHIDHIYPLSKTDINNEEAIMKTLHYTNLQPLWFKDNIKKGNKI